MAESMQDLQLAEGKVMDLKFAEMKIVRLAFELIEVKVAHLAVELWGSWAELKVSVMAVL